MNHPYELHYEETEIQSAYINFMQSRLDWCVATERYEMAARLRDLIKYETTKDEDFKTKYYLDLLKTYAPDFYEMKNKTTNYDTHR